MRRRMLLTLFALLLSATPFSIAHAEYRSWNHEECGSGGSWTTDTSCWSYNSQPASGDSVVLRQNDITGGYTVTYDSNSYIDLYSLTVGDDSPGTVALEITTPDAYIDATYFFVGSTAVNGIGFGAVAQEDGTVNSVSLYLGFGSGDSGSYTLTGGSLHATYENIGDYGSRGFFHDGGTGAKKNDQNATS